MKSRFAFLDMDGVIADFIAGTMRLYGRTDHPNADPKTHGVCLWNFWGMSAAEFRDPIRAAGRSFWEELPKTPDADAIVEATISQFGKDNVAILTDPALGGGGCIEGKKAWIEREYPALLPSMIFTGAKRFLAGSGVLIDDMDRNVDSFVNAGGEAVLVPRLWNREYRTFQEGRTLEYLYNGLLYQPGSDGAAGQPVLYQ